MQQLKIGVIGCGHVASVAHIPILARMRGARISAIADIDEAALRYAGRLAPRATRHSSYAGLLEAGEADAVIILLPSAVHAEAAIAAFRAGVNVYLEKPIATSIADSTAVIEAWHRSGKTGVIGHNLRFNALYRRLRHMVQNGTVGPPVEIVTELRVPPPSSASWRSSVATGGGVLLDLATHHIDLIRFLTGSEIETVSGKVESRRNDSDYARLELTLASGAKTISTFSHDAVFTDTVLVKGESGSMKVDRARSWDVEVMRDSVPQRHRNRVPGISDLAYIAKKLRSPFHEPSFELALSAFVDAVRTGARASPDLEDGFAALRVADAARRSAISGLPVAVDKHVTRGTPIGRSILGHA